MRSFLQANEIWVFFAAILIANAVFVGGIAGGILPFGLYGLGRFLLLGAVLFAVVFLSRGGAGVGELLRPMLRWRVSPVWYLVAILWGAVNMILFLVAKGVVTGNGLSEVTANLAPVLRPGMLLTLFVGSFIGEIVWISYSVSRLWHRHAPYTAALIVGVVWTLWWLPMVVLNIGIVPDLPFVALLINQTGVAVVATFLYWHTRSGLIVLIGQMLFNAGLLVFPVIPTTGGVPTYYAFAVFFFVTTTCLFLVKGPRPMFGSGAANRTSPT